MDYEKAIKRLVGEYEKELVALDNIRLDFNYGKPERDTADGKHTSLCFVISDLKKLLESEDK